MKTRADLVKGWIQKAESNFTNARICFDAGKALDTACFHAQQAAEKYLKAYLTAYEIDFPFIHNLEKLIELSAGHDASFMDIKTFGQELTPYAVELRYDNEFWPSMESVKQALDSAITIKDFVFNKLPEEMKTKM